MSDKKKIAFFSTIHIETDSKIQMGRESRLGEAKCEIMKNAAKQRVKQLKQEKQSSSSFFFLLLFSLFFFFFFFSEVGGGETKIQRETETKTDRQTNRQTDRQRHRHRERLLKYDTKYDAGSQFSFRSR